MEEILILEYGGVQEIETSNEEWEVEIRRPIDRENLELDLQTNVHGMVEDAFQQVNELGALEDKAMEVVEQAFEIANGLQEEANVGNGNNNANELSINIEEEHEPLGKMAS